MCEKSLRLIFKTFIKIVKYEEIFEKFEKIIKNYRKL